MLLAGETVTAAEAEIAGAIARVVPREGFADALDVLVDALRSGAPQSIRGNRNLLRALEALPIDDATLITHDDARERAYRSRDHAEARQAFRERRKPAFTGE
jgi:enoyl-CoA hydratase/carnithine racemase